MSPAPSAPSAEALIADPLWQTQPDPIPSPAALLAAKSLIDFAGVDHTFPLQPGRPNVHGQADDAIFSLLGELNDDGTAYGGFGMPFDFEQGVFVASNGAEASHVADFDTTPGPRLSGATGDISLVNSMNLVPGPSSATSADKHPLPTSGSTIPPSLPAVGPGSTADPLSGAAVTEDVLIEHERPQRARKLPGRYNEAAQPPSKRPKPNRVVADAADDATKDTEMGEEADGAEVQSGAKARTMGSKVKAGARARGGASVGATRGGANGSVRGGSGGAARGKAARGKAARGKSVRGGAKAGAARGRVKAGAAQQD